MTYGPPQGLPPRWKRSGERTHTRRAGARGPDPQLQQEVLHRTRLVLRAKGNRHEVININLRNKPEWYYTKHPFGQITGLENSQCHLIYESVITCPTFDQAVAGSIEMWETVC
ncbi:glutathione S-transferase omega-2-like [Manis javanica]|uniref:glutathione S-transferase omega-2-like n=1 Tax=Manis javanica TaxID=9974 RepID=UPI003C6D4CE6